MKRLILPLALAAFLAGCGQLPFFGPQSGQAEVVPDTLELYETTRVVREIHEVPVYYAETVYVAQEPVPAETVLFVEEYENVVMVPGLPPHRRRHRPRWSPGLPEPPRREESEREPPPRGERPDDPDPEPPPRGRREPDPAPEPTPPEETVAEETQPHQDPGTGSVPAEVAEEELPVVISPPVEPVVPVTFVPSPAPTPVQTKPAPRPAVKTEAPGQPTEDSGPGAEQPRVRGRRPARGERETSEQAESEGADQVADN
jgi:hypothetical protein